MRRTVLRESAQWLGRRAKAPRAQWICPFSVQQQQPQRQQPFRPFSVSRRAYQDAALATQEPESTAEEQDTAPIDEIALEDLPSPPPDFAAKSAKLSALHARLGLPSRFPVETLARCLIDASADPNPAFNNASLSILGSDVLGYHTSEHVLCHYPRLPIAVLFAAQYAYIGPRALAAIAREWGVEAAAAPGGEVDPGFLQFQRVSPGSSFDSEPIRPGSASPIGDLTEGTNATPGPGWRRREAEAKGWRRGISSRIVYDDQFGDLGRPANPDGTPAAVTLEDASSSFVRALLGGIYLHLGRPAAKKFFTAHFLSRHLNFASLFDFHSPNIDLSRLCAREGFEPPVARLISETGRLSRTPVFVVGVYSGQDKLGEGIGASLNEARFKACAAALKSWYLYSPLEVTVPSETEGVKEGEKRRWKANVVDCGEVVS